MQFTCRSGREFGFNDAFGLGLKNQLTLVDSDLFCFFDIPSKLVNEKTLIWVVYCFVDRQFSTRIFWTRT